MMDDNGMEALNRKNDVVIVVAWAIVLVIMMLERMKKRGTEADNNNSNLSGDVLHLCYRKPCACCNSSKLCFSKRNHILTIFPSCPISLSGINLRLTAFYHVVVFHLLLLVFATFNIFSASGSDFGLCQLLVWCRSSGFDVWRGSIGVAEDV